MSGKRFIENVAFRWIGFSMMSRGSLGKSPEDRHSSIGTGMGLCRALVMSLMQLEN